MTSFYENVKPYFDAELAEYEQKIRQNESLAAFTHLEDAHVIGQESTRLHIAAHYHMAVWAFRERKVSEFFGQLLRIVGAATKTAFGLVPIGNTGGANISPFKALPLSEKNQNIIAAAKART